MSMGCRSHATNCVSYYSPAQKVSRLAKMSANSIVGNTSTTHVNGDGMNLQLCVNTQGL